LKVEGKKPHSSLNNILVLKLNKTTVQIVEEIIHIIEICVTYCLFKLIDIKIIWMKICLRIYFIRECSYIQYLSLKVIMISFHQI